MQLASVFVSVYTLTVIGIDRWVNFLFFSSSQEFSIDFYIKKKVFRRLKTVFRVETFFYKGL
jgi:hypothetical protein